MMGKSIQDVMTEVNKLHIAMKKLLVSVDYGCDETCANVYYDRLNADELFQLDELWQILGKLEDISQTLDYLRRPIKAEGILFRNDNGRFEMEDGHEFLSGQRVEYLVSDGLHDIYDEESDDYITAAYWCSGRVEHNGSDYYIVGTDAELDGLKVRYREM